MKKGHWSSAEDDILREYVEEHGGGKWDLIEKHSILPRSGKSCRLRWLNHLRPHLKKSPISTQETQLLIHLHERMGNKWAQMTKFFPGRTDNELKNFWNKLIRRGRQTGFPAYSVDGGSSRASDQNHRQQQESYARTGIAPSGHVSPPNISNCTAADEEQTGCSSTRQKCDRNSTCPDAVVHNYEASDRVPMESEWQSIVEDFLNSWEVDVGVITDEQALPLNALTFRDPSLYENPAAVAEHNEIFDNSEAGVKEDPVLSRQDFFMPYELLEETQLEENYLVANSNPMSEDEDEDEDEDEIAALLKQVCRNEHKMEVSEAIDYYEEPLARDDHHFECESLHTTASFTKNPATIVENNGILHNSEYELVEATLLKENYLVANSTPMSEDEIATLLESINYEQPLAQDDHHFECESLNTTTSLLRNPATIIENDEILDNSDVGLEDEHVLPQQDFSMPYKRREETQLKENYLVANFNPMSEDEIAFLDHDFCNEHKMTLSEAINSELPLAQCGHQFEAEYGGLTCLEGDQGGLPDASKSNKNEAAAVDAKLLPIATMEEKHVLTKESLEQIRSNITWNETFSGCNLAMDWELPSIQNEDFDGLGDI